MKLSWFTFAVVLFVTSQTFAQAPAGYKKIEFVYEQRTNYTIKKEGFYADTLLLKIDFPDEQFELVDNPEKPDEKIGYIKFKQLSSSQRSQFRSRIWHAEKNIYGVYDVATNTTSLFHQRQDKKWQWKTSIDFNVNQIYLQKPMFESENPPTIVYDDQAHLSGRYKNKYGNWVFDNIVVFDPEVPKFVATDDAYITGEFGIKKIITMRSTTQLKSVVYK